MDDDADNNRGAFAPQDNHLSIMDDVDGDSLGDLVNQCEAIVLDAESDGEEDESFNIDEHGEDPTDDELEYDSDEVFDHASLTRLVIKKKGWLPTNNSASVLGEDSKALLFWRETDKKLSAGKSRL